MGEDTPLVGVVMGSDSDWPTMQAAAEVLDDFGIPYEVDVVSAHRMPEDMIAYGRSAADRGLRVVVAGAGGAAHLPGMVASLTVLPVIGVPVPTRHLGGVDSLHSIVQMPSGVPVATMSIGGAANAGLMALRMLALAFLILVGVVLIADDESLLRRLMKRVLEASGYRVIMAADGDEALAALAAEGDGIGVVVLDLLMPPFEGIETLRRVVKARPGVGIVLTSGLTPDLAVQALVAEQGGLFLAKPFAPEALRRAVETVGDGGER